jgi:NAD(P)-dependent dehydrogenase (short-subunit alcohol dehydrogenase family)
MTQPFQDKVISITGGAGGIGLATARYLAERGAIVSIAEILEAELADAVKTIQTAMPSASISAHVVNVCLFEEVPRRPAEVNAKHGKIYGCLNGAGVPSKKKKKKPLASCAVVSDMTQVLQDTSARG